MNRTLHYLLLRSMLSPSIETKCLHKYPLKYISFTSTNRNNDWGANKTNRKIKIPTTHKTNLADNTKITTILEPLRASVKEQGDIVRKLKETKALEIDLKKAIVELNKRKSLLKQQESYLLPADEYFDRAKMEDLVRRRFFYDQSFDIYGGVAGLLDLGPMGCALKSNIIQVWRKMFIHQEQMLEVDCSILTPEHVLKASGHVERFADLMTKDVKTGEYFRVDHLIKSQLEKLASDVNTTTDSQAKLNEILTRLDGMTKEELTKIMDMYSIKSPIKGNDLSVPTQFNLMLETQIGPSGLIKGYLRPEMAQGIFVNFKKLLNFNQGKLPFAAAQIGNSFRNEISPHAGLLRMREFTMCEIEHFCDTKEHSKFDSVRDTKLLLYSALHQEKGKSAEEMTIGEAVSNGIVNNETLGYFMAKIQRYLQTVGIIPSRLRFRQHTGNEMAHYACDCWDAECLTSYGWIECVGCADRAAYDLTQHSKAAGVKLSAERKLSEPKVVEILEAALDKQSLRKDLKRYCKIITEALTQLDSDELQNIQKCFRENDEYTLKTSSGEFRINSSIVTVKKVQKKIYVEDVVPNVIEPSFGVGRILYCILEHSFRIREENDRRSYFSLPPAVAPIKCAVLPLSGNEEFEPFIEDLSMSLTNLDISHKVVDTSGSIGRRYTRTDELGVPFAITIDFDTLQKPNTVTLRERDTTAQLRIPLCEVSSLIIDLATNNTSWSNLEKKYPKFEQQDTVRAVVA